LPSPDYERPVFLVGMMGAGKSTVGRHLADQTGRCFVDLDREVEATGASIEALFAAGREAEFRALEARALRAIDVPGAVVATGGGVVLDASNVDHMIARGRVVYLRARPEALAARLAGTMRPLLQRYEHDRTQRLAELLSERRAAYERAHLCFDTDGVTPDEVVSALTRWLAHG
jgi:shikimate kinase